MAGALDWGTARVGYLGLPARYPGTPVETISVKDVEALSGALLRRAGRKSGARGRWTAAAASARDRRSRARGTKRRPGFFPP